jgi:hypothetical protein
VRRFLSSPFGWLAFQCVEVALIVTLDRILIRIFPYRSTEIAWSMLALIVVVFVGNYTVRRRYLS